MADQKANQHTSLAIADIIANHIFRTSKEDAAGNNKITLPEYKKYTTRNRVSYDSGAVPDASTFGDGALVVFGSGATNLPTFWGGTLETRAVLLHTYFDAAADTIRYESHGNALFYFQTGDIYFEASIQFTPSLNLLQGFLRRRMHIVQTGTNDPVITEVGSDLLAGLIDTPARAEFGIYTFNISVASLASKTLSFHISSCYGALSGAVANWEQSGQTVTVVTSALGSPIDDCLNGLCEVIFPLI